MRITPAFITATLLTLASIAPAAAQPSPAVAPDARWTAWLGCWQQLDEAVRDENLTDHDQDAGVPTRGVSVCVTPASESAGVSLSTIVEKQFVFEETVIADGTTRAIVEPGCTGSQHARWSENGRHVFARAELACADGTKRTISGLTMIAPGPTWVDIQVVESEGRESIRVRRYRRSPDQSYVSTRLTRDQLAKASLAARQQARPLTLDEVKEASAKNAPSTVEAALVETGARFPLNAKRLEELDAAGVPDRVMDLMIALSFPQKFLVERRTSSSSGAAPWSGIDPSGMGSDLWWIDAGYDMFPYRYAPFGYGMWGRSDYYYYGAPVYAVGVESTNEPRPSGEGRVVDGMGYTRVRAREPQPGTPGGFSADGSSGGSSGGSSSSGGGVSSQGYSGGGGGDSGRTAVARPPQ